MCVWGILRLFFDFYVECGDLVEIVEILVSIIKILIMCYSLNIDYLKVFF